MRPTFFLAILVFACGGGSSGPNDDADGDFISNADEGFESGVNTDSDSWDDWLDRDSDGDGFTDAQEAGDEDLSTPPFDRDGDGVPDFQDLDSDNDGVPDWAPFAADPNVDTDGDGIPNGEDDDDDDDGILDRLEGGPVDRDTDGDGLPDRVDADSDNDGIPDAIEGNVDTDDDGIPDFIDTDSDNDGLPDEDEDLDGDGEVAPCDPIDLPCESSRLEVDTDGDGIDDLVERVAGTDPVDAASVIPSGDFYFVLPYEGESQDGVFDFATLSLRKVDVFFSVDTTGSFGEEIAAIQASIDTLIVPGVSAVVGDAAFGVGRFEDFPVEPFGTSVDVPYELLQSVTTNSGLLRTAVDALPPAFGGFDTAEAGMEALYQWATGFGVPSLDLEPFAPGDVGGAGFRSGALPIVIQITDAASHAPEEYAAQGIVTHGRDETVAALNANAIRVIGVRSVENDGVEGDPRAELEDLALATRATAPAVGGECATGIDGAAQPPVSVGGVDTCPLVFDVRTDGTGLAEVLVDAIEQLIEVGEIDISAEPVGNAEGERGEILPLGTTTADFIASIRPEPPAPDGSTIDGDVFRGVVFGSTVTFRVEAVNDFVPSLTVPQLFTVDINVLGDGVTVLDVKNVYIVVPAVVDGPVLL